MFAIAASSFSRPSETFIRDHARAIAPDETAIISHAPPPEEFDGAPALRGIDLGAWPGQSNPARKAVDMGRRYWRRYASPYLPDKDNQRVIDFLKQHNVSALMCEYGPTGVMLAKPAQEASVPLYVHFHGFDAAVMARAPFWPARYRRLFESAAGVIGPSRFIANKLEALGCASEKLHVCACGIDPDRFAPGHRASPRLVAVGRLVPKKAPHIAIKAFGLIADQYPEARLDIIGDGPLAGRCRSLVKSLGLSERVFLHGRQPHVFVSALMGEACAFVQHSVTTPLGDVEGLPVSILEAMACGLPVISTRHSGIQEAVLEGETGFLAAEEDVEGMAQAMASVLSDPARGLEMGDAGRARVLAHYTQEKSAATLRAIMGL